MYGICQYADVLYTYAMAHTISLLKKESVAAQTSQFYFSRPDGFEYKSGQSIDIKIENPPETDAEGNTRSFSLTSAPHEDFLSIASRMRDSAFKRSLQHGVDLQFTMEGPFGSMTLHNDTRKPAIFLAGGIGITPFYSMVKHAVREKLPHHLHLFYSNRTPPDAPFLTELKELQKQNQNFSMVPTMTKSESWDGEKGHISSEMVKKYIPDFSNAVGYIAGPAPFVVAMKKVLSELGVNDDFIRLEEFAGY
jgi:ferredoxin-NADP reductase